MIRDPVLGRKTGTNGVLRIISLASQCMVSQGFGDSDMKLVVNGSVFVVARKGIHLV